MDLRLRSPLLSVKPSHMPVLGWTTIETGNSSNKHDKNKNGDV